MTPKDADTIARLRAAVAAPELTAGPWQVVETEIPHRLGGHHIERRIFATWDHPQLKGPLGVVNHSIGVGAEEGSHSIHLVQIDAPDATFIAAANPSAIQSLLALLDAQAVELEGMRKALEDALSACSSVSIGAHRKVVIGDCVMYAQSDEWCKWVDEEVQPIIRAALTPDGR